ncbi:MAG: isoleucine--tRNA ligase [Synergistaceae bacterium]|jgi:isoleucyl-tRNA synthetase|nr:isoleucine--tRNA ligase [Synergistaceae bacterium]
MCKECKDYKDTLNLPVTNFPMRANLASREPAFLKFWQENDTYRKVLKRREGAEKFILHDGPPYANANIHIGTAFNKILKDFIPKYKLMSGFYSPFIPGYDTHGLPTELRVLKDEKMSKEAADPVLLRKKCTEFAYRFIDVQTEEFKRLGVFGEWDNPYITLKPEYEAVELDTFADMVDKDLVYRGLKPVYWCVDCQTALATGEIEYWDESSPSVYIAYPVPEAGGSGNTPPKYPQLTGKDVYVVIWTTTPWTLPASMAVALHPQYEYGFYEAGGKVYLIAEELRDSVAKETGLALGEPLLKVKGAELEGLISIHPFYDDRKVPLILADYIQLDSGTGCVHTAPGHGTEDFESGVKYGIDIYNPVDDAGRYLKHTPLVGGMDIISGGKKALELIAERGRLLGSGTIMHSYPHCWRCKKPVIFRATEQWFISVSKFRDRALEVIDNEVRWIPDWGHDRIYNMVRDRSDWCISRQRIWGVPIPALKCGDCGEHSLTSQRIRLFAKKVKNSPEGCSIWWDKEQTPESLFGDLAVCDACGSRNVSKDSNIIDVWFDSGISHFAVLNTREGHEWPTGIYLEGSDQHRGWFQSSLLTAVAVKNKAPYRQVLTHGFILDGEGRKMSKSLGNSVFPQEVVDEYGADILRLWVASTDYRNDVRISKPIMKSLSETYRRIRNTARFLLGNLHGFDPQKHAVPREKMLPMDRWILSKLNHVIERAGDGFENYEYHLPTYAIHSFCVTELSAFYLDVNKDRLYVEATDSLLRRSAQTAMWEALSAITRMLATILSFTSEEIWQEMRAIDPSLPESVFLTDFPKPDAGAIDESLDALWDKVLVLRGAVSRMLEELRAAKTIGTSLEAFVQVKKTDGLADIASAFTLQEMADIAIVSKFEWVDELTGTKIVKDEETGYEMSAAFTSGSKCPRCWKYSETPTEDGLCPRCAGVLKG